MLGIVILITIGTVVPMGFGFADKTKGWHLLISAVLASLLFQVAGFMQLGYLDPLAPIAFIASMFWYLILGGVIFGVFKFIRR